ncbi:MAG: EamA family transporter [Actinomycetota bacterium]|nr:EamA family transporter [Actinomycetota bacterium]
MSRFDRLPPWTVALTSMFSVQLGSALSINLIAKVGPAGSAWLRIMAAAIFFIAWKRPSIKAIKKIDILPIVVLGVVNGLATSAFMAAIARIPLGTTVAIEFLGPMIVAAKQRTTKRALAWPIIAFAGVALLTQLWQGRLNLAGLLFAAFAGIGWGLYVVLTQRIGDRFEGATGLALTMPIAAVAAAIIGAPQAIGRIDLYVVGISLGLAILFPILPYALEMYALRRMTHNAFGTLMAIEPAIGTLLGLIILHQMPNAIELIGLTLVVVAGVAAQRNGLREMDNI